MSELSESQLAALRRSFEHSHSGSLDRHAAYRDQYRNQDTQRVWAAYLMGAVNMMDLMTEEKEF